MVVHIVLNSYSVLQPDLRVLRRSRRIIWIAQVLEVPVRKLVYLPRVEHHFTIAKESVDARMNDGLTYKNKVKK